MPNNRFNKQVTPKGNKSGGSVKEEPIRDRMKQPLKTKSGGKKTNPFDPNKDTKKRTTKGFKKGGVASEAKKKQFKENKAGQKSFNKKAMKIAKGVLNFAVPAVGAAEVGKKIARKFKGAK